jgi:hypothetical protein
MNTIAEYSLLVETVLRPLVLRRRSELARARATRKAVESLLLKLAELEGIPPSPSAALVADGGADSADGLAAGKPHRALVDIGAGFKVQARLSRPERVAVDVGVGLYLDMELEEAVRYCRGRLETLQRLTVILESEVEKTGKDLATADEGIAELEAELEREKRDRRR